MKVRESEKWLIAGAVGLLVVAALYTPVSTTPTPKWVRVRSDLRNVVLACKLYAADNEGQFPAYLGALYPEYIDVKSVFEVRDKHGNKQNFDYVPGLDDSYPGDTIFLASPFAVEGKWIVGFVDGRVKEIDERPELGSPLDPVELEP